MHVNAWYLAAAGLSLVTCLIHVFAGGRDAVRPLLASDALTDDVKYTHLMCWHLVTLMFLSMTASFVLAAALASDAVAWIATVHALLCVVWNVGMIATYRLRARDFPQWILFAAIAGLGAIGLWPS